MEGESPILRIYYNNIYIIRIYILKEVQNPLGYSNLSKEKWKAERPLANVTNIVIKKVDKVSCVVIWNWSD